MLDKEKKTLGKRQYHIHLSPGDIGEYVLLPGDPARSNRVAAYLDDAHLVAENREHRTFTGYYKGVRISVTSTGMGCPSTAIACEELINIGAKCLVRIGSTAALQEGISIGDLIVSTGSMKNEGTSRFYVPDVFPAVPDFDFTRAIIDTARDMQKECGYGFFYGINASDDAFYGETPEWIGKLHDLGVLNVEMESSAIYTVCHRRKVRGAMISAVSGNLITGEVIYETENKKLADGWDKEIKVILEAISRFDKELRERNGNA
ncbi:MAG: nucleoside phosphorylase [Spirochaetes bacterium]|uniref:Uridine phosphorylase n=1 Tax=Candidatus Ornithospirochaeta stercoripullorum TaxID=2840899 RepID=A0A9D9E0W3_9SPIO|nr:nucleoside phosphorylase [Candidatus Ornithospirochaeta stercoripullorum]